MSDIELIKSLNSTGKGFFTPADLEKVTGLERASLYVALNRWVRKGLLERAAHGVYVVSGQAAQPEVIAQQLYFPCYLSFESALSRHGVLNLVPYSLTFATAKKTKATEVLGQSVNYRHIMDGLFFGFAMAGGLYVAEAEKALLDLVYLDAFGKAQLPLEEIDARWLSLPRLREYASRFPRRVTKALEVLVDRAGA